MRHTGCWCTRAAAILLPLLVLCDVDYLHELAKDPAKEFGVFHFEVSGSQLDTPVIAHVYLRARPVDKHQVEVQGFAYLETAASCDTKWGHLGQPWGESMQAPTFDLRSDAAPNYHETAAAVVAFSVQYVAEDEGKSPYVLSATLQSADALSGGLSWLHFNNASDRRVDIHPIFLHLSGPPSASASASTPAIVLEHPPREATVDAVLWPGHPSGSRGAATVPPGYYSLALASHVSWHRALGVSRHLLYLGPGTRRRLTADAASITFTSSSGSSKASKFNSNSSSKASKASSNSSSSLSVMHNATTVAAATWAVRELALGGALQLVSWGFAESGLAECGTMDYWDQALVYNHALLAGWGRRKHLLLLDLDEYLLMPGRPPPSYARGDGGVLPRMLAPGGCLAGSADYVVLAGLPTYCTACADRNETELGAWLRLGPRQAWRQGRYEVLMGDDDSDDTRGEDTTSGDGGGSHNGHGSHGGPSRKALQKVIANPDVVRFFTVHYGKRYEPERPSGTYELGRHGWHVVQPGPAAAYPYPQWEAVPPADCVMLLHLRNHMVQRDAGHGRGSGSGSGGSGPGHVGEQQQQGQGKGAQEEGRGEGEGEAHNEKQREKGDEEEPRGMPLPEGSLWPLDHAATKWLP